MKRALAIGLLFFLPFLFAPQAYAIKETSTPLPSSTPASSTDSFTLFWPLVAGRTMDDPLYFLKTLKENIRGFFIFGRAQKADYMTFIATKRVVETEALLNNGKKDWAIKTLDRGIADLSSAASSWTDVKSSDPALIQPEKENIQKQLTNLGVFLNFLSSKNQAEVKSKLDEVRNKAEDFQKSL